jgi:arylformamidase
MSAIFLSHNISSTTPLYGGEKTISFKTLSSIVSGDSANTLNITLPNHSGTHVDVPYHFFDDGKKITDYPASFWCFERPQCIDLTVKADQLISNEHVAGLINRNTDLLMIRTGFENYRDQREYWEHNPGLSAAFAKELREGFPHIRAVGMDIISVTARQHRIEGRMAHGEFLGQHGKSEPIVLIEDMSLRHYSPKFKQVIILPLMIQGADGAPCTVIAKCLGD